jgi:hypothetical protein
MASGWLFPQGTAIIDMNKLVAVFSDVHGNHYALQACIDDACQQANKLQLPLSVWFLGDLINGYPGANQCFRLLDDLNFSLDVLLRGNHDLAQQLWWPEGYDSRPLPYEEIASVSARVRDSNYVREKMWINLLAFNAMTLNQLRETRPVLWQRWFNAPTWTLADAEHRIYAAHGLIAHEDPYHFSSACQGLLDEPVQIGLLRAYKYVRADKSSLPPILLVGHTHLPELYALKSGQWSRFSVGKKTIENHANFFYNDDLKNLPETEFWVINVGSVGMQRNRVWPDRAAYLLLEIHSDSSIRLAFRRPRYPLEEALREYRQSGCHPDLLKRLEEGY